MKEGGKMKTSVRWEEAIERFLEAWFGRLDAQTLCTYRSLLTQLQHHVNDQGIALGEFGPEHMEVYIAKRCRDGRQPTTLYSDGIIIAKFLKWCAERKIV